MKLRVYWYVIILGVCACTMTACTGFKVNKSNQVVALSQASYAAGLMAGSQQRLLKNGIDFNSLQKGVAETYLQFPDDHKVASARELAAHLLRSTDVSAPKKLPILLREEASYALGMLMALDAMQQLKVLEIVEYTKGFKAGFQKTIKPEKLAQATMLVSDYYQLERLKYADQRLEKAAIFLAENAKNPKVMTTATGLQYEILAEGNGDKPRMVDSVRVNYRHTKPDSDFFYDSAQNGHSETFPLRGAVPEGWRELFLLMSPGAKYRVYLPPALGFGLEGNGDYLLPNEVLITEFTLLEIIPPAPVVSDPWVF